MCLFWEAQLCKDCLIATEDLSTKRVCPCPSTLLRGKLCWDPPSLRDGLDGHVPPGTNLVFHGSPPSPLGVCSGDIPRGGRDGKGKCFLQGLQQHHLAGLLQPRAAPCPAFPMRVQCRSVVWLRCTCSHLVPHLKWLVAESESDHQNKIFLEICFCSTFSRLLLDIQFGPGSS